jgi:hypothetical protein
MNRTTCLTLALAALLAGCSGGAGDPATNCTMTLSGEGADPALWCEYAASPTLVQVSENGGPAQSAWGLVVHGWRDAAQADQAVAVMVTFDPGSEPAVATTYACQQGSDPGVNWSADALRGSGPSTLTHSMHSPMAGYAGRGELSVTFTSVCSTASPSSPTHGALDATLVAVDGSGKTLALRVDF